MKKQIVITVIFLVIAIASVAQSPGLLSIKIGVGRQQSFMGTGYTGEIGVKIGKSEFNFFVNKNNDIRGVGGYYKFFMFQKHKKFFPYVSIQGLRIHNGRFFPDPLIQYSGFISLGAQLRVFHNLFADYSVGLGKSSWRSLDGNSSPFLQGWVSTGIFKFGLSYYFKIKADKPQTVDSAFHATTNTISGKNSVGLSCYFPFDLSPELGVIITPQFAHYFGKDLGITAGIDTRISGSSSDTSIPFFRILGGRIGGIWTPVRTKKVSFSPIVDFGISNTRYQSDNFPFFHYDIGLISTYKVTQVIDLNIGLRRVKPFYFDNSIINFQQIHFQAGINYTFHPATAH